MPKSTLVVVLAVLAVAVALPGTAASQQTEEDPRRTVAALLAEAEQFSRDLGAVLAWRSC